MNALLCDIARGPDKAASLLPQTFARTGASSPARQTRCPYCDSIIYSRRHKLCGVCAEELPSEFLFNDAQAQNVKLLLREEQMRHRALMQRSLFAN